MNEAADRLRKYLRARNHRGGLPLVDEALAAERKATVERIRAALLAEGADHTHSDGVRYFHGAQVDAILDAEAQR